MGKEADVLEIECCPFCKEAEDLELLTDEGIVICNNCGRNFKIIEDNLNY